MNYNSFNIAPLPLKSNDIKGFQTLAFTLAETMVVLIVLGVVASITIPPLVRRQIEAANRAKIKKSMTVYDYVMNNMTTEHNLKSDAEVVAFAGDENNNCAGSTKYFKKAEGDGCRFKTSDGVWWNIDDILNPTIALNEDDLDNPNAQNRFKLLAHFGKAGELRVNDLQYELTNEELTEDQLKNLKDLYAFVLNKAKTFCDGEDSCTSGGLTWNKFTIGSGEGITLTKSIYNAPFCSWEKNNQGIYTEICGVESKASEGQLYISEPLTITEADAKKYCDKSRNKSYCESNGDYWIASKIACEQAGGRLSTTAELKVMSNKGQLDSNVYYWATETTTDSGTHGASGFYAGLIDVGDVNFHGKAICLGK